jgi:MYXO-CTERM domain-containing protein
LVAVAVVIGSACTALHYSTTSQQSVTIAGNPYTFPGPGSQMFTIAPAGSSAHDILQTIDLDNCDSQWTLNTSIDPQQPVMGAHVCGFGGGSAQATQSDIILCPRNYQFAVHYSGAIPGLSSCLVQISSMDYFGSGFNLYTLMLDGTGSAGTGISVSPPNIDFGSVQINTTSAAQTVTVKNNGSTSLVVNGSLQASGFMVTPNPSSFTVNGGSIAEFDVTCRPTMVGGLGGSFDFSVSGVSMGSVPVACTGIDSTVTVQPGAVTFANTLVGRSPPNKTIDITGNPNALIVSVTLGSDAMANGVTLVADPSGTQVGSGQSIVVAYDGAAVHAAGPLGSLAVQIDVETMPRNVSISGQALLGGVGTNPASVELGAVCVGDTVVKDVEVYASEAGDVVVSSVTPPTPPFAASITDSLPKTLAGSHTGPSITVHSGIAPTAPGEFRDTFVVSSDVPNKPSTEVQLHGVALAAGIAATPNVVHFGTTAPGTTTSIKEIQLTNCGSGDLMLSGASITGAYASEFTLIGANPPRTLLSTESEVFTVVMQPDSGGFKTAQLVIQHSEGATTVDLDGTGDGGSPKDRETYYACSTGRGAALWPIALALLALRRRRR